MTLDNDDLKFNFGCRSYGYKSQSPDQPIGKIPIRQILEKLDSLFARNDMQSAGRLLDYWRKDALSLRDKQGELTIVSEQMGYFRKTGEMDKALESVSRGLALIEELDIWDSVSAATIFLNAATTLKAFGKAEEALPLYENTLSIYNANLPQEDLRFGGFYNNYALALVDLEQFPEAEEAYLAALKVVLPQEKGRLDGASTYVNMAYLYESWKGASCPEIGTCLDKALEILDDTRIAQDGYLAFVLSKCAPGYRHFGMETVADRLSARSEVLYARH